jgi:hypothetical protein
MLTDKGQVQVSSSRCFGIGWLVEHANCCHVAPSDVDRANMSVTKLLTKEGSQSYTHSHSI